MFFTSKTLGHSRKMLGGIMRFYKKDGLPSLAIATPEITAYSTGEEVAN